MQGCRCDGSFVVTFFDCCIIHIGKSKLGRRVDALALGGDEGRDKLR